MKYALFILACLGFSLALAMGTPPQKSTRPATEAPGSGARMLRDDELRITPDASARLSGRLARGTPVRVLASQGGWTQVSGNGQTGWVRILSVQGSGGSQGGADLSELVEAGMTSRDPGQVVAVAGVRGLDEALLKAAAFDPAQIKILRGYAMGRIEAEQFAQAAGLKMNPLPYLPAPSDASSWKDMKP